MASKIKGFQKTLDLSHAWIQDLMGTYEYQDENEAFVVLRATLKALRDRILPGEAFHLGSQLPALLRGFFYEGWNPGKGQVKDRTVTNFLSTVRFHFTGHDEIDLERAVPGALRVIFEKIDQGEAEDVRRALPKEIQELCS